MCSLQLLLTGVFFLCSWKSFAHDAPKPAFTVQDMCVGDTARILNLSTGAFSYTWVISSVDLIQETRSPIDSFSTDDFKYYIAAPGAYEVLLYAYNGHLSSFSHTFVLGQGLLPDFDYEFCTIQLLNWSTCADNYYWDFGDGSYSNISSPIHWFADTGTYFVKLVVNSGSAYDSIIKAVHIKEVGIPNASFTVQLTGSLLTGSIVDTTSKGLKVRWEYGDGSFDTTNAVTHKYPDSLAQYFLIVTVRGSCGVVWRDTSLFVDTTGVGLTEYDHKSSLFPNPANSHFIVTGLLPGQVELVSLTGAQCRAETLFDPEGLKVSTENLSPGVYLLKWQNARSRKSWKFAVNR